MTRAALALGVLALLAGCEQPEPVPPDRALQVAGAGSLFDPAAFDTVTWASDEARLDAGNEVFAVRCRKCHGPLGYGDTPYAMEEGLDVPSLVEPEWAPADDIGEVRRRIFVGHPDGMPTWGVGGLTAREIDAVTHYIVHRLRPEAQRGGRDGG